MKFTGAVLLILTTPRIVAQSGGVVEGTVANSVTHAGIAGVGVALTPVAGTRRSQSSAYHATTDATGVFRIAEVEEGEYTASFERAGFSAPDPPAWKPFSVGSGRDTIRLRVELVPWATLRGRVIDSEGRPAPKVRVEAGRFRRGMPSVTATNAEGLFVFDALTKGDYVLLARPILAGSVLSADREKISMLQPPAEGERWIWAPTYFPGVNGRMQAERIIVSAGAELYGYEIRLCSVPAYRIRGIVVDEDGKRAARVPVKLTPANPWEPQEGETVSGDDGAFEFAAVRQGEWRFIAETKRNEMVLKGFEGASVTRQDVDNVEIRLSAPFTLNGFVDREEARDSAGNRKVTAVSLIASDGPVEQRIMAFHEQDGTLHLNNVFPGRYQITPLGFVPGYYLESVLLGNRQVIGQEVDLMQGSPPIRIIYRPAAGRVRGTVEKGELSTVVLLPKDEAFLDGQFIRSARCESGGRFEIGSLRPGDYYALAFDRVDFHALEDPAFVRGVASRADSVRVAQGQIASIDLEVTPWPE